MCEEINTGSHKWRHIGDICIDVLSTPKYHILTAWTPLSKNYATFLKWIFFGDTLLHVEFWMFCWKTFGQVTLHSNSGVITLRFTKKSRLGYPPFYKRCLKNILVIMITVKLFWGTPGTSSECLLLDPVYCIIIYYQHYSAHQTNNNQD